MCLSPATRRPKDVLATGTHAGYEWAVMSNSLGFRCGYVKVPVGHPWYGQLCEDVPCTIHGGLTFADPDYPEGLGGWWLGFSCDAGGDAPDPALGARRWPISRNGAVVRSQEYAEAECRKLCEQVRDAKPIPLSAEASFRLAKFAP